MWQKPRARPLPPKRLGNLGLISLSGLTSSRSTAMPWALVSSVVMKHRGRLVALGCVSWRCLTASGHSDCVTVLGGARSVEDWGKSLSERLPFCRGRERREKSNFADFASTLFASRHIIASLRLTLLSHPPENCMSRVRPSFLNRAISQAERGAFLPQYSFVSPSFHARLDVKRHQ